MYRLLVIDADTGTHDTVRSLTANDGGDVASAFSNDEALALLESGQEFDVALVNIDAGPGPTLEVFKSLTRRDIRLARIGLTRDGQLEQVRHALRDGAVDILRKPLVLDDASATLTRVMKTIERRRRNWNERAAYSALQREIQLAAEMQQRILPKRYPVYPELQVFGNMLPAKIMGGDLFDVFPLEGAKMGFFIGDVAGKSVPAAFYMAVARTLLRSISDNAESPSECLTKVDELLSAHEIPGTFVTTFLGILDTDTFDIVYANGGHPLPFLLAADGPLTEVEGGHGTVLGIGAGLDYQEGTLRLNPGDTLVTYTDGVTEAVDLENHAFGEDGLARVLVDGCADPPDALCARISSRIEEHGHGREQHDDLTVLAIRRDRRCPAPPGYRG